jgi:hypothetical protein
VHEKKHAVLVKPREVVVIWEVHGQIYFLVMDPAPDRVLSKPRGLKPGPKLWRLVIFLIKPDLGLGSESSSSTPRASCRFGFVGRVACDLA